MLSSTTLSPRLCLFQPRNQDVTSSRFYVNHATTTKSLINTPDSIATSFQVPFDVSTNIVAMPWNPKVSVRRIIDHFIRSVTKSTCHVGNLCLRKMKESGQLDRIIRAWISKPSTDCWGASEFKSMGIEDTVSAFAVIGVAVCLAAVLFVLELVFGVLYKL